MQSVNVSSSGIIDLFSEQTLPVLLRRIAALDLGHIRTPERLATMACIMSKPGPISVSALAHEQQVRAATMSRMLSSLHDDGLIRRVTDEEDGRGCLVTTTPRGRRATEQARKIYRAGLAALFAVAA